MEKNSIQTLKNREQTLNIKKKTKRTLKNYITKIKKKKKIQN